MFFSLTILVMNVNGQIKSKATSFHQRLNHNPVLHPGDGFAIVICMKAKIFLKQAIGFSVLLAMLSFIFAGCKSTPKVDWNSRIGNYTYDQAVAELGPPDKTAKLSDGKTVADWIKHSPGGGVSFGLGTGFYGRGTGVGTGVSTSTGHPDRVLRLTFGPDGKLLEFKKTY